MSESGTFSVTRVIFSNFPTPLHIQLPMFAYPVEDNVILAMCLGAVKAVRDKLANKSSTARGTLHGRAVDGRRFERQPHLGDVSRLKFYTSCGFITCPQTSPRSEVLVEEEEEVGRQGGKWSPVEFKVLECSRWCTGRLRRIYRSWTPSMKSRRKTTTRTSKAHRDNPHAVVLGVTAFYRAMVGVFN